MHTWFYISHIISHNAYWFFACCHMHEFYLNGLVQCQVITLKYTFMFDFCACVIIYYWINWMTSCEMYVCDFSKEITWQGFPSPLLFLFVSLSFLVHSGPHPSIALVDTAAAFCLWACVDEKSSLCRGIDRFFAAHRWSVWEGKTFLIYFPKIKVYRKLDFERSFWPAITFFLLYCETAKLACSDTDNIF